MNKKIISGAAALPQIFIGCNQGLSVSFILLTSAEMIGAQSGLDITSRIIPTSGITQELSWDFSL